MMEGNNPFVVRSDSSNIQPQNDLWIFCVQNQIGGYYERKCIDETGLL